jgi:hypothetical protein
VLLFILHIIYYKDSKEDKSMSSIEERKGLEYALQDGETKRWIHFMCKKCKFYDNGCIKGRVIRECAEKGLKNKD